MKKILFFDVDGTLYNSEKTLPSSAKQAVLKAKENGHVVAIATGRAPFMIADLLEELAITTYVSFNGQYVVHNGEVIYTNGIEINMLREIVMFGEKRNEPVVFLDEKCMMASVSGHHGVSESIESLKFPYPAIDDSYYMKNQVYQTLVFVEEQDEYLYRNKFHEVDFVRWHKYSCDVLPKGGSKAKGIQILLDKLGRTVDDIITFGDGLNDIEMLKLAGTSVAMGNGHEEVKHVATHIAGHVDEDGLAKIMEQLKLI